MCNNGIKGVNHFKSHIFSPVIALAAHAAWTVRKSFNQSAAAAACTSSAMVCVREWRCAAAAVGRIWRWQVAQVACRQAGRLFFCVASGANECVAPGAPRAAPRSRLRQAPKFTAGRQASMSTAAAAFLPFFHWTGVQVAPRGRLISSPIRRSERAAINRPLGWHPRTNVDWGKERACEFSLYCAVHDNRELGLK